MLHSTAYKKVFKAFNFTQRATTDAKMTSLKSTNNFSMHNDLSYYDYKFNDFVPLANTGTAKGYVYVWMAPKQQTVNIYNKEENNGSPVETKQVSKTQFMLMAMLQRQVLETVLYQNLSLIYLLMVHVLTMCLVETIQLRVVLYTTSLH